MARPFFSRWLRSAFLATGATLVLVFASLGVKAVFAPEHMALADVVPSLPVLSGKTALDWHGNDCNDRSAPANSISFSQGGAKAMQMRLLVCLQEQSLLAEFAHCQTNSEHLHAPPPTNSLPQQSIFTISMLLSPLALLLFVILYSLSYQTRTGGHQLESDMQKFSQSLDHFLVLQQQSSQHRERLMQEACHDLSTRLHAVQLLAYTLQQELPSDLQESTTRLNSAIAQLQQFVQEFLSFSRLPQGQLARQCRDFHLQDLFQQLELQFEDIAVEQRIDLRIHACDIHLHSDPLLLERLLANLLSNALKFAHQRVLLVARVRRHALWIEVRDDGPGIPAEEQAAIFSAFYRSPQASHTPGLGLGLAIVQRLSSTLGYQIEVISHPGRGSLMRVIIQTEFLR